MSIWGFTAIRRRLETWRRFLSIQLWEPELEDLPRLQAFVFRQLRVAVLLCNALLQGRLALRASAMTFTTLVTLIPLLVVAFSIFRAVGGFPGIEDRLEAFVLENVAPASQGQIREWLYRFFESVRDGAYSGITVIALLGGGLALLGSIEAAFNEIWAVRRRRPLLQRFSIYITLVALGPILVGLSLSMTASIESATFWSWIERDSPALTALIGIGFKIAPIFLTGLALTILYTILPNARVRLRASLPAGLTAALLFELSKSAYAIYLRGATHYSALYGSIAAIPIFVVWVHVAWLVVLFGAELTFARDAAHDLRDEERALGASERERLRVALFLSVEAARTYLAARPPLGLVELARRLRLPLRMVTSVAEALIDRGILHLVQTNDKEGALVPARPPEEVTVYEIIRGMLDQGTSLGTRGAQDAAALEIEQVMADFDASLREDWEQVPLRDLAERGSGQGAFRRSQARRSTSRS